MIAAEEAAGGRLLVAGEFGTLVGWSDEASSLSIEP